MNKKDFKYVPDCKIYEYENKILRVELEREDFSDDIILKIGKIIETYPQKIKEIANFCKESECFKECYPEETEESIIKKLNKPVIRFFGEEGILTYCEHEFDEDHILDIDFDGILEKFSYIGIDG